MNTDFDDEIKEKIAVERTIIPERINDKIQDTLQNLTVKKKQTNKKILVASSLVAMSFLCFILSNNYSLAQSIPFVASIQKYFSLSDNYEKVAEKSSATQISNGVKVEITRTIFDGYQLLVAYKVNSSKAFQEKPSILPNNAIIKANGSETNITSDTEYGQFIDNQKKTYTGVAVFSLNKGSFESINSENINNDQYYYDEKALQGQQIDIANLPDKFDLEFDINQLGREEEKIEGKWSFKLPIESEKAKGNVKEVVVDADFSKIGPDIAVEKAVVTPIRIYLQSTASDKDSFLDYLIKDDKGETKKWLGGSVAGHYIGKERSISNFENNNTAVNSISIIPYRLNKSYKMEGVTLNKIGSTKLPIDNNKILTITNVVEKEGKTYFYYQSDYPLSDYLPFTLKDSEGKEYIRNLEESKELQQDKESVLVFDGILLDKNLTVYNPNTYYYDYELTVNLK
ncbi:DUF4179 domain-containing protein [Bacillus sp. 03113]|uniref:DUF4179 domain-containing protein n=1 Tax=Bacillus sp. 03113 TaxID=2578211 RepID=UPI001142C3FD|nr:DUF4179 domain-containing protein [Bacillus sp. 03113]